MLILSTSSRQNTGLLTFAFLRDWIILPGMAPIYVRLWPLISASSRTPPSDRRANSRPVARATDLATEVLPTPGGPTRQRIGPLIFFISDCTARYSRIRSFGRLSP